MIRARVITCSDGVARGTREDKSGQAVRELLVRNGFEVDRVVVVPDEINEIALAIADGIDADIRLVVTTGGTGISPRDVTPEATMRVCDRVVPGFGELMRLKSLEENADGLFVEGTGGNKRVGTDPEFTRFRKGLMRKPGSSSSLSSSRARSVDRTARRPAPGRTAEAQRTVAVRIGLENLLDDPTPIAGKRIGLVTHPSAVTSDLQHAIPLLHAGRGWKLTTLFGPEHGMWGEAQDMAHVTDAVDPLTGLRVYSLYGASVNDLAPRSEMLKNINALVIDLQDIGSRYYTFIYTMALCMRQAAEVGLPVIVLDRPNPIDGVHLEGNIREEKYSSFVGMFPLPTRHGMTAGELARYFNKTFNLNCDLTVIPMRGWKRSMWWGDTGLPWVIPSPNMPTVFTAAVYPGMCLIEGTNLSEGRGTTHPFEFFGAPWLNPFKLADELNRLELPGVRFRPHYFLPTFQKHAGKVCGGVEMHVTHRPTFEPYRTGLWCVKVARDLDPEKFDWRRETYEFVSDRLAIDLLAGSAKYRELVERGGDVDDWVAEWEDELREFAQRRQDFLLYRD